MSIERFAGRAKAVDDYFSARLLELDSDLRAVLEANERAGLPAIDVSPLQGRLLEILARSIAARRILEVGTLGGYSTLWLAGALPDGGEIVTLEVNPAHADVARSNFARAGRSHLVRLVVGKAEDSLQQLVAERSAPFDLIFIDADKPNNPTYLKFALALSRPGTLIILDNVVRGGSVVDSASTDANVIGVRNAIDLIAAEPRLIATAVQTVGNKGHDGFLIAIVGVAKPDGGQ